METRQLIHYELTIHSHEESCAQIDEFVEELFNKHRISFDLYAKIKVSIEEALKNAYIHGNKCNINKEIKLSCDIKGKRIKFCVEDQGEGFNHLLMLSKPYNDDDLTDGGGLYLLTSLCDEIEYIGSGSKVFLTFNNERPKHYQ